MLDQARSQPKTPLDGNRQLRSILLASAIWTAIVWGSRIRLIDADAGWWAQSRIYVSLVFGLALLTMTLARRPLVRRTALITMLAYAIWMVIAWIPSLISVLGSSRSIGFQVVHTTLAVGSLTSGALVAGGARRLAVYPPITTSTHTAANSAAR